MERLISFLLILSCSFVMAIHAGDLKTCARDYEKYGCFADKSDQSKNLLVYARYSIQWKNIKAFMHSLACTCEEKAREKKYPGFAIHFWGECYGKTQAQIDALEGKIPSNQCTGNQDYKGCLVGDKECAGHAYTDFVYKMKEKSSFEKIFCNDTDSTIQCSNGKKVALSAGSYGPKTADICGSPTTVGWEEKCSAFSEDDFLAYRDICFGVSKCTLAGWSSPIKDPCKGTIKYLKIQYKCVA